jgi:hypothetical protein
MHLIVTIGWGLGCGRRRPRRSWADRRSTATTRRTIARLRGGPAVRPRPTDQPGRLRLRSSAVSEDGRCSSTGPGWTRTGRRCDPRPSRKTASCCYRRRMHPAVGWAPWDVSAPLGHRCCHVTWSSHHQPTRRQTEPAYARASAGARYVASASASRISAMSPRIVNALVASRSGPWLIVCRASRTCLYCSSAPE